ncbi:MAG: hypothetical protein IPF53_09875 [Blastocatellia bacterium]|jgi:hypothetical protein|nr:hypothetical protein [Blastocatellia bacterium]MBK6424926.1 hypothetical protein [Blastocatellia bacterium]
MTSETEEPVAAESGSRQTLPPKPRAADQTVCDEPGEKNDPCFGHLKRYEVAPKELLEALPEGEILFRCIRCFRLYHGAPMKFLR